MSAAGLLAFWILAQQASNGAGDVVIWSLVLIVALVVMFIGIAWLRRWMAGPAEPAGGTGFTLSDLREMHRKGQLSDEEFERAKLQMVATARAAANKPKPDAPGGPSDLKVDL